MDAKRIVATLAGGLMAVGLASSVGAAGSGP